MGYDLHERWVAPVDVLGAIGQDPFANHGVRVGDVRPTLKADFEIFGRGHVVHFFADLSFDDGAEVGWVRVTAAVAWVMGAGRRGVRVGFVVGVVADYADAGVPGDGHFVVAVGCVHPEV